MPTPRTVARGCPAGRGRWRAEGPRRVPREGPRRSPSPPPLRAVVTGCVLGSVVTGAAVGRVVEQLRQGIIEVGGLGLRPAAGESDGVGEPLCGGGQIRVRPQ